MSDPNASHPGRSAPRYGIRLRAKLTWPGHEASGDISDLSDTGAGILLKPGAPAPTSGQAVSLHIDFYADGKELVMVAEVSRVTQRRRLLRKRSLVGLRFAELSPSKRAELEHFVQLAGDPPTSALTTPSGEVPL